MVRTLLQNGADVNCSGENDPESALNSAIEVGNIQIFEFLIAAGADVNFAAESLEYGRTTPLQLGVQTGHPDMVHTLLLHGADANAPATIRSEKTALQAAAEDGDVEMVHQFLSLGADVNAPAAGGGRRTALQWAAQEGHVEMFHCLLSAGADVNAAPALGGGVTALQAAAIGGYGGIVVDLLKAGATVESPGAKFDGRNAIEAAAEHGRLDILCLLLDAHEDGELLQKTLEQAAELAEDEDHVVIAQFLREYKKA
jgi:ankyrin repeat protein